MLKETQPLLFEEIKQGSPKSYISYRKLTPDAFRQIKGQLGKPINVTFVNESWAYQGPTDEEDHSTNETHVSGTLIKVDERTIGIQVNSGEKNMIMEMLLSIEKHMRNSRSIKNNLP